MGRDDRDILEALKAELDFMEKGGYRRSARTPWRPTSIFQDSPTCLNFSGPEESRPCTECLLMKFVPPARHREKVPCHHIPLNERGDTVDNVERWGDQQEIEEAVKNWLRVTIKELEQEQAKRAAT